MLPFDLSEQVGDGNREFRRRAAAIARAVVVTFPRCDTDGADLERS